MIDWILGFMAGLAITSVIAFLIYRSKCEHDWKFVERVEYHYRRNPLPHRAVDLYKCSNCNEYKKVRKT